MRKVCLLMTNRCGFNCHHCYTPKESPIDMSIDVAYEALEYIRHANVPSLQLSGGEPMIWSPIDAIIDNPIRQFLCDSKYFYNIPRLEIVTTGVTLAPRKRNDFYIDETTLALFYTAVDKLCLSLDASNAELQEQLGRGKYHFDRTRYILKTLQNMPTPMRPKEFEIQVNTTVTKENLNNIPKMATLIAEYQVPAWNIRQFAPFRGAAATNMGKLAVTDEEFRRLADRIQVLPILNNVKVKIKPVEKLRDSIVVFPDGGVNYTGELEERIIGEFGRTFAGGRNDPYDFLSGYARCG